MRIGIVNSFFPPWRGGAEAYVYNLARQLGKRGHEVVVFCGNEPLNPGRQILDGVTVERMKIIGRIFGTPVTASLPLKLLREDLDVIHANFPSPYNAFFAALASKLKETPALLTWHNDLPPVTLAARMLVVAHDELVLPLYIPRFHYVIATSDNYARSSRILKRYADRVVVVRNGVDTERFNPAVSGDKVRSSLDLGSGSVILFVGALTRWHRYKGLDILMKAIALLKKDTTRLRLLIVGGGELSPEYQDLADRLGILDYVTFAGDVANEELPEYYAASDMLVLPSKDRSEGFGLVLLEANATGKPVVGAAVGGIPSVIRDGYNGLLVPPNNPQAVAEAIGKLLADKDRLRQMGKNGRVFAEAHDWSVVAEQTEQLYKRALAGRW